MVERSGPNDIPATEATKQQLLTTCFTFSTLIEPGRLYIGSGKGAHGEQIKIWLHNAYDFTHDVGDGKGPAYKLPGMKKVLLDVVDPREIDEQDRGLKSTSYLILEDGTFKVKVNSVEESELDEDVRKFAELFSKSVQTASKTEMTDDFREGSEGDAQALLQLISDTKSKKFRRHSYGRRFSERDLKIKMAIDGTFASLLSYFTVNQVLEGSVTYSVIGAALGLYYDYSTYDDLKKLIKAKK